MFTEQEYIAIKEIGYEYAELLKDLKPFQKCQMLDRMVFHSPEEKKIIESTILFPYDLKLIELFKSSKQLNKIASELGISLAMITRKKIEFACYKTQELVENRQIHPPKNNIAEIETQLDVDLLLKGLLFGHQSYLVEQFLDEVIEEEKINNRLA